MSQLVIWFCYANLVALLVGAAAFVAERALMSTGRPVRLAWAAGIFLSVLLPLAAFLFGEQVMTLAGLSAVDETVGEALLALSGDEVTYRAARDRYAVAADPSPWIAGFWMVASGLAVAWLLWSVRRLGAAREKWTEARVADGSFYLTSSMGPGVLGVLRQRILLPRWTLGLEPEERELIWAHETEHVRAGDNRLLAAALAALVAAPWVLPLWWQFRRLEVACEIDCDRRVLARVGDRRGYGELLIRMASGATLLPMASFSLGRSSLERRIRALGGSRGDGSGRRTPGIAGAGLVVAGLLVATLALPVPATGTNWSVLPLPPSAVISTLDPPLERYDESPSLANRAEVEELIRRRYPAELRRRGVQGTTGVLIHITEEGTVDQVRLHRPSPYEELNRLVKDAAFARRFRPARLNGVAVDVWIYMLLEYPPPTM